MELTITPAAEKFIRRLLRFGGGPGQGFRLVMSTGGCAGLSGEFSIEAAPRAGDSVVERDGLRFFLPAESRLLLAGVTIDFADTPTQTGLVFHDPKQTACGCGSSGNGITSAAPVSIDISRIERRH